MENKSQLEVIGAEISRELATPEVKRALLETTFKGLPELAMRQAIFEGMIRGFAFKDFLQKDVYAIPFKKKDGSVGYSLVTSIDRARKIGMRSGLAGKDAPVYKYLDAEKKNIESCTVTVKRSVDGLIGNYTATVFFSEYKGGNLWLSKPHTMIAKVAEMHALRSAFPEEMAKEYIAEEFDRESDGQSAIIQETRLDEYEAKLKATKTLEELRVAYSMVPEPAKTKLREVAEQLKQQYENNKI